MSIHSREFHLSDVRKLEQFARFPLDERCQVKRTIEVDGKPIGLAFLKVTTEVGLVLDPSLSRITKARVLRLIFLQFLKVLLNLGLSDTHVFVLPQEDKEHAELLKRHFGFVDATGIPLYWSL